MRGALGVLFALLACAAASNEKKIVCYFGSWAVYRPGNGAIEISHIDPKLCTHLIYTFIGITSDGQLKILDPWADLPDGGGRDGFNKFNQLRGQNPSAKTLIAIGGWNEGSVKYSQMAKNPTTRSAFVENTVKFVRQYDFDGFDLDWEYPGQRGGAVEDKENFVILLKEMKKRFDGEGLLLTAAFGASAIKAPLSYKLPEVTEYLHFINLMAYDFHGVWDKKTGINAPLYPHSSELGNDRLLNVNESINYWLREGTPPEKIVLGIPLYGRTFTLDNVQDNGIGAPASTPGNAGPYTRQDGTLGYNEICEMQSSGGWEVHFQKEQRVPYAVKGNQWIGYEDIRSIQEKAEYINNRNLGGAMIWSIETDDFRGICGNKYPLLKTLNHVLRDGEPLLPPTTGNPITTTSTTAGPNDDICHE